MEYSCQGIVKCVKRSNKALFDTIKVALTDIIKVRLKIHLISPRKSQVCYELLSCMTWLMELISYKNAASLPMSTFLYVP